MRVCLLSCYFLSEEIVGFLNDLRTILSANGFELIVVSHVNQPLLDAKLIILPYSFIEYTGHSFAPDIDGAFTVPDSRHRELIDTDMLFKKDPKGSFSEHFQGYLLCRDVLERLVTILCPSIGIVWGMSHPQSQVLTDIFRDNGIPAYSLERGLFADTLMIEPALYHSEPCLNRGSDIWKDWGDIDEYGSYDTIRRYYLENKPQKYFQTDYTPPDRLRESLRLGDTQTVVFWGQHDIWSGILPRGNARSHLLSPFFGTSGEALVKLSQSIENIPGVSLIFKPHPHDTIDYEKIAGASTVIARDINNHSLFELADVFVAMLTTTQFEALLYEKPIILLANSQLKGRGIAYEYGIRSTMESLIVQALNKDRHDTRIRNTKKLVSGLFRDFLYRYRPLVPANKNVHDFAGFIEDSALQNGKEWDPFTLVSVCRDMLTQPGPGEIILDGKSPRMPEDMHVSTMKDSQLPGWNLMTKNQKEASMNEPFETQLIAFYLPQYHPIPENDRWWGKGFTEWTNVSKARPLFPGHYQPHVPADLGYYDLRLSELRKAQAELAKKYGVAGFCYYHYWFHGKQLLHQVFDEVLSSGKPDFPFCLCWANENWTRVWDGGDKKILMEQQYSPEDDLEHITWLIHAFKDARYIKIEGRPLLLVYRTSNLPDAGKISSIWREEVKRAGLPDLYLCTVESFASEHKDPRYSGFNAAVEFQPDWSRLGNENGGLPGLHVFDYRETTERMISKSRPGYTRFPCVTPCWDNSPRRGRDGYIFHGSRPVYYEKWLRNAVSSVRNNIPGERIVFINAWNEWAEGNHLEPDQKHGHAYLSATKRALTVSSERAGHNEELTSRAEIAIDAGRLDEAESLLKDALSHYSEATRTLHRLGILKHLKGETQQAIALLEKAMSLDPSDAELVNDLGTLYYPEVQDKAYELFQKAIDLDNDLLDARKNLADLHAAAGRITEAENLYREILSCNPDDPETLTALENLMRFSGQTADANAARKCDNNVHSAENPLLRKGICNICGARDGFSLTNQQNPRESWVCLSCGSTSRDRMYINALALATGNTTPLVDWSKNKSVHVLEAAGARAHPGILKNKFTYLNTSYVPEKMMDQNFDKNLYADLQSLHYEDHSFDIVMSSDVFEHVRLYKEALKEIFRVLKPDGIMVLQAPFHPENRENIIRVQPEGDDDIFLCPPTYHDENTLVYRIYGAEFIAEIESAGFTVQVIQDEVSLNCITPQAIIIARKPGSRGLPESISKGSKMVAQGESFHENGERPASLEKESSRMKRDWNARAEENARYYIHSTKTDQSEEEFDASGKHNVQTLVIDDLMAITCDRDPKTMSALEIGCGIGRMTRHLAAVFEHVHAVDVSGEMIQGARKRLADLPNVSCCETSGTDLSLFSDGMFDFVFSFIVFQHIPSREVILNYIRESYRVLKKGGVFKFQVQGCTNPQWMHAEKDTWHGVTITEEDVCAIAAELGFTLLAKSGQGTQYSWYILEKTGISAPLEKPLASIIIPVYNQKEYTIQCLDALRKHTPEDLYEIIVVDNCSTDGTHDYLMGIEGSVKVVTNRENQGFTVACNQGAREASGKFLVFLNNDTMPLKGWLTALLDTFKLGDDIAAVGSKLIYPDMKLQEAGGIIFNDGNGWNFGRGDIPDNGRYNRLIEVDYCSGASLAVRKELFEQAGGFDEIYAPAYYEDTDLCFSLREAGYRVLYQPESEIIHFEGKTAGVSTNSGFKRYQVINRDKFRKKWAHRLKDQGPSPYEGAPKPFTADRERRLAGFAHHNRTNSLEGVCAEETSETKNFLIIDPFLPIYDKASGSFRLYQIVKILANTPRVHVTYIARHGHHGDKYVKLLTSMGVEVHHTDPEKMFSFDLFIHKSSINLKYLLAKRHYDYAFLSFYEIATQYLPDIRLYSPSTRVIIDTVDIHFLREMRQAELYSDDALLLKARNTQKNETDIYSRADALITVTEQDAEVIRPFLSDRSIYVIPNIHPVRQGEINFKNRSGIIFIGNYYHPPNIDAVEYYLRDIHPKIQEKGLSIPVSIIGDGLPEQVKELGKGYKDITFTGWVPETRPFLDSARISIAPLRYGAGMKGKVGEALAAGLPVVTTPIGAEGMGLTHGQDIMVAHSADEFAETITRLYEDSSLWASLSTNGIRFIESNYSTDAVAQRVRSIFHLSQSAGSLEEHILEKKPLMVSIIIPCFNQIEYTKKCLKSIDQHTTVPHELLLVDNGSTDGTREYLQKYSETRAHVQLIVNDKNLGFAAANNQAFKKSGGECLLLLNNDVVVTEKWLEKLLEHIEKSPDTGMVGPMSNAVSGPQLVQKVPYGSSMNAMQSFARDFTARHSGKTTESMRLVGFCLLIKKEVIDVIGGFDEHYISGNFEDDDLCLRSFIAGYRNIIAHDVFIHHYGSMTFKGNAIDYQATMKGNLEYFTGKWKDIIEVKGNQYRVILSKEQQLKKLIEWGEERFSQGDVRWAIKVFERTLELDRGNSQALNNLGVIQWQLGNEASAMKTFQRALIINPKDRDALGNLIQAVSKTGRFDQLNQNLLEILKQAQPTNPDVTRLFDVQQNAASPV